MKKILSVILTIVLFTCGITVGNEFVRADIWNNDIFNTSTLALVLTDSTGNSQSQSGTYEIGDDFYFKTSFYPNDSTKNKKAVKKINIMDEEGNQYNNVSGFVYKNVNIWEDAYDFMGTKDDNSPETTVTVGYNYDYFKVQFNASGRYTIEYSYAFFVQNTRYYGRKYIFLKNGTYRISDSPEEETEETTTQAPATHDIYIDNVVVDSVQNGSNYKVPSDARCGYYERNSKVLYSLGTTIKNVTHALKFDSVNSIEVHNAAGASIKLDGIHGIKFQSSVIVKNLNNENITQRLVTSGVVRVGTLLTPDDVRTEVFGGMFDKKCIDEVDPEHNKHIDILNKKDDWPISNGNPVYGTCYAGIKNVQVFNLARDYTSSPYALADYQLNNGEVYTETYITTDKHPVRSIQYVAEQIKKHNYDGCKTQEQRDLIDYYCDL